MRIEKTDSGLLSSWMYVIEENGHAIIIDPCKNTDSYNGLKIDCLITTHEHYDHISGVNEWKQISGAPLLCSKSCAENVNDPRKNMSRYFDVFCEIQTWTPQERMSVKPVEYKCEADKVFEDTMAFDWQGHTVKLIEIPGHSIGSIGIDIDGTDFFSGDSLMKDYEIALRFPGGSKRKWETIGRKRIEAIPEGTRIWPGHFDDFIL